MGRQEQKERKVEKLKCFLWVRFCCSYFYHYISLGTLLMVGPVYICTPLSFKSVRATHKGKGSALYKIHYLPHPLFWRALMSPSVNGHLSTPLTLPLLCSLIFPAFTLRHLMKETLWECMNGLRDLLGWNLLCIQDVGSLIGVLDN